MDFELSPDQQTIVDFAAKLAHEHFAQRAARWDRNAEYPWENIQQLVAAGICGMTIPEQYGGQGRPLVDAILVVTEIAKVCGVTARIVVETNMGAIGAIMRYGTEEQKRRYGPLVVAGDKPCICITEPEAGTAATDMKTTATLAGDRYVLNGRKHWITGGGIGTVNLVFARIVEGGKDLGIGGLIVEKGTPGFNFGKIEDAMGLRGIPETELLFDDCSVPRENVLVPGGGFGRLMAAYNGQRVGAAAVALGLACGAFELATEYSKMRTQFGRPICEFQGLMWMLADMKMQLEASRLLIWQAATTLEHGFPRLLETSLAKAYAGDMALKVTNDALQIFGSSGYSREYPLERMARDARMFKIGGGTSEAQKNQIAAGVLKRRFDWRRI